MGPTMTGPNSVAILGPVGLSPSPGWSQFLMSGSRYHQTWSETLSWPEADTGTEYVWEPRHSTE